MGRYFALLKEQIRCCLLVVYIAANGFFLCFIYVVWVFLWIILIMADIFEADAAEFSGRLGRFFLSGTFTKRFIRWFSQIMFLQPLLFART